MKRIERLKKSFLKYLCIILVITNICIVKNAKASNYNFFIGKSLTKYNSYSSQNKKNEHLTRLKDNINLNTGVSYFNKDQTISLTTNRLLNKSYKSRFNTLEVKRKVVVDTLSIGNFIKKNISVSLLISNINLKDKLNGIVYKKSAITKGFGCTYYFLSNNITIYYYLKNRELQFKNAAGLNYSYLF